MQFLSLNLPLIRSYRPIYSLSSLHSSPHSLSTNTQQSPQSLSLLLHSSINLPQTLQILSQTFRANHHQNNLLSTKLIGKLPTPFALRFFHLLQNPTIFPFNAIIRILSESALSLEAFSLYKLLLLHSVRPNSFTFSLLFKACSGLPGPQLVKVVHAHVLKFGGDGDLCVQVSLLTSYVNSTCQLMYARKVFDEMHERSPFSWTTMIAGYAKAGHAQEALNVFVEMRERGVKPSNDTMVSVLSACAKLSMEDSEKWRLVFSRKLCEGDVSRTALVYLYAKNGEIVKAWKVFDGILESERSVVAWNTMINGFVHSGLADEALALFDRMRAIGQIPNHLTMVSVLSACARVRALELGESITDYVTRIISREIFQTNAILATALIDMYAKCGQIDRARSTFEALRNKDVVSWNAMTMGLALHGQANEALMLFSKMETLGLRPNAMTFLAILCACAHSGLVERGCQFFEAMSRNYRITPGVEHYSCLVDLLGRNGRLDEAREVIRSMPIEPNALVWGALLGACIVHSRADLIEDCHRNLIELDPKKPANYVLLSNFYAFDGRWDDIANVRVLMKESGVRKEPGCSWIERGGIVQKFIHDSTKLHYRQVL